MEGQEERIVVDGVERLVLWVPKGSPRPFVKAVRGQVFAWDKDPLEHRDAQLLGMTTWDE